MAVAVIANFSFSEMCKLLAEAAILGLVKRLYRVPLTYGRIYAKK